MEYRRIMRRRGVGMIEYGILAALIGVVCIAAVMRLGGNASSLYCAISDHMVAASKDATGDITHCDALTTYGTGAKYNSTSAPISSCNAYCSAGVTSVDSQALTILNALSPVVGVYGLKDGAGNMVTTEAAALAANNLGVTRTYGVQDGDEYYQYEVKTQDGNRYGFFDIGSTVGYRNLATGETYELQQNTSNVTDIGVTTGSIGND